MPSPVCCETRHPGGSPCQEAGDLAVFADPSPKTMHKGGHESPSLCPVLQGPGLQWEPASVSSQMACVSLSSTNAADRY